VCTARHRDAWSGDHARIHAQGHRKLAETSDLVVVDVAAKARASSVRLGGEFRATVRRITTTPIRTIGGVGCRLLVRCWRLAITKGRHVRQAKVPRSAGRDGHADLLGRIKFGPTGQINSLKPRP